MKPERNSKTILATTRAKAKMYEYNVPEGYHIEIKQNPDRLFALTIGMVGDLSAAINDSEFTEEGVNNDFRDNLTFSAQFFDAYFQSRLQPETNQYFILLGSATYYLCELPGSANVLARNLNQEMLNLGDRNLSVLLHWLLRGNFQQEMNLSMSVYNEFISNIATRVRNFFKTGEATRIDTVLKNFRDYVYTVGSSRELLFADIICAVTKKLLINSVWNLLPIYSGIGSKYWLDAFQKDGVTKELWPAQKLLGEKDVYKGKSAIIQMPTSAGKTKATEFIIRSAFISGRSNLAVIVAPFKALCHEIHNNLKKNFLGERVKIDELTDVIQNDVFFEIIDYEKQIIVVTPEKLNYLLRHRPELINSIKLIIYDEGHLFDDTTRGVTYELLLSELKSKLPQDAQIVLISAIINNADEISRWLLHDKGQVISGTNLIPTYRSIGFASWKTEVGRLEFVDPEDPNLNIFFVPRLIAQNDLQRRGKERIPRKFPEKNNNGDIALYFALKLNGNGSVAIFTGRKDSACNLCESVVEKYERNIPIPPPSVNSDPDEIKKLVHISEANFGANSPITKAAKLGIFMHHGSTPQGMRLTIEHALQNNLIRFVICTSTLAQGVNLPIRYLIIDNVRHGMERIKTRDFYNLMGRAGRSGIHTEGSVLFANPDIYDSKDNQSGNRPWKEALDLLNHNKAEVYKSHILRLFDLLHSDDERYTSRLGLIELIQAYTDNPANLHIICEELAKAHTDKKFTRKGLWIQMESKLLTIKAIESYIMANYADDKASGEEEILDSNGLIEGTLAFFQANDEEKKQLKELIRILSEHILKTEADSTKRKIFSRTLLGINECKEIEKWIIEHIEALRNSSADEELFEAIWPLFINYIKNSSFSRCTPKEALKTISQNWILGISFQELFTFLDGCRIGTRYPKMENVVNICENGLGFDGTLIVGCISQIVRLVDSDDNSTLADRLDILQKRLQYGLAHQREIIIFELGFADRHLTKELATIVEGIKETRNSILESLNQNERMVRNILRKYPSYFEMKWNLLVAET